MNHRLEDINSDQGMVPLVILGSLFLLVAHYQQIHGGGHALYLPFNTISWVPVFLLLACGALQCGKRQALVCTRVTKFLFLACALLSVPLLYLNAQFGEVAYRIIGVWAGFLLFVSLQQYRLTKGQLLWLFLFLLLSVWIEAIRYWKVMLQSYIALGQFPTEDLLLYGVFGQRNVMSSFIATGIVISAYLLGQLKNFRHQKVALAVLILTPLLCSQILQSMASRAGWYGAVIGIILILPYLLRNANRKHIILWVLMAIVGSSISLFLSSTGGWSPPSKDVLSLAGPRTVLFPQALAMFLDKPLFGFGYGTFESSYIHYIAENFAAGTTSQVSIPTTFHPHNEFLLWGVEGGIVPVIGLLLAATGVWLVVLKFDLLHRLAIIGLFLPLALHSQVEFPFYSSVLHWVIFILLIYYVDTLNSETLSLGFGRKAGVLIKSAGVLVPSLAIVFLLTTLYSGIVLERFNNNLIAMRDLAKINNPIVWVDRINFTVYVNVLLRGIATQNPREIQEYINWVPTLLAREPRPIFYEYLILAHQALNQSEKVDEIVAEYRYLFPQQSFTIVNLN